MSVFRRPTLARVRPMLAVNGRPAEECVVIVKEERPAPPPAQPWTLPSPSVIIGWNAAGELVSGWLVPWLPESNF